MTKSTDNFLLIQITGRRFQPTNRLHLFVQLKGFIFGDGAFCWRSRFQIVQFKRLFILSSSSSVAAAVTMAAYTFTYVSASNIYVCVRVFAVRRTEKSREEEGEQRIRKRKITKRIVLNERWEFYPYSVCCVCYNHDTVCVCVCVCDCTRDNVWHENANVKYVYRYRNLRP